MNLIQLLQTLPAWVEGPMEILSFLGREEFYMLVIPFLFWCVDTRLGLRIGAMLVLTGGLNAYLKVLFHTPRPYWVSAQVRALSIETSFGMPSGHAQNAASLWGLAGAQLRRPWALVGAAVIILGIGLSRLYLAVHFPQDVLTGWLAGLALLLAFLWLEKPLLNWFRRLSFPAQVAAGFLSALLLVAIHLLTLASLGGWQVPAEWAANAALADPLVPISPLAISGTLTVAGTWFGLVSGAAWLDRSGGFRPDGSLVRRATRYLIGLAGVVVLWYGLGQFFPRGEDFLSLTLRFLRYALVSGWVTALAPAIFRRWKI